MKLYTLLFLALLAVAACQKDESPSPAVPPPPVNTPPPVTPNPEITLLTFKQDVSSSTSFSDDWIFVTSESGEILGVKQFEADQLLTLKSDKITAAQKFNVNIFHYRQPDTETIDFTSYLGITPGQAWIYGKINPYSPEKTGTATFNVTNTTASASLGMTVSTNLGSSSTRISSPFIVTFNLYKSLERILVVDNINDVPSYFEASNIQDGNIVTVDYNTDFKPLQEMYTIDISESQSFSGSVSGITNETGVDPINIPGLLNYSNSIGTSPGILGSLGSAFKWGYNSGFDLYRTSMGKSIGNTSRQYFKLGSPVTTIPFPDHSFALTNSNLNGFTFSLSGPYQLRSSRWTIAVPDYKSVLSWRVYAGPEGKQVLPKIPDEIKSLYPSLVIESLVLKENAFFIYLDGFTYSDFINGQMNIASSKKPYSSEYQKIIIQN